MTERDELDVKLSRYERLVEATAPPPANPVVCTCNRCFYAPRYIGPRMSNTHPGSDTGQPAA